MSSGAERSVPAVGRPRLCWIIGFLSLRMRAPLSSGSSKSAISSRDASRQPPWRRWSTSCRYQAWKRPPGHALSVYEGARLRQPAHERRASVTAGFAYARVRCVTALGRSHAVGAAGSGHGAGGRAPVPPQPTGRRQGPLRRCAAASGPRTRCLLASFSRYACLSCSLSVPQAASNEAQTCVRGPPAAPSWLAGAVRPQALPPAPRPDLLVAPVAAEASSRRALWECIVVTVV